MVDVASVMNTVTTILWSVIAIVGVGLGFWAVYYLKSYKHTVLVFDQTAGGNIVRERKAKELKDEKNVPSWYVRGEKITMSSPPKEAIAIKKGKKFSVLVKIQADQYHWLNVAELKEDAVAKTGKYFVIAEDAKRQFADQIKKAEQERSTKLNQLLQQILPLAMIGILLIGAYFMWDTIGAKNVEVSENLAAVSGQLAKATEQNVASLKLIYDVLGNKTAVNNPASNIPAGRVPN